MSTAPTTEIPRGNLNGFVRYSGKDLVSGFLVFLIALPLCLGISIASGYPPIAGVFTAIVGAVLTTFLSNSELTIKGPAAGLIVIAVGCIMDFRVIAADASNGAFTSDSAEAAFAAYRMALAVGVVAGVIQILFGLFRLGILGEFFPTSVVHGMLAAIGVIIIAKQVPLTVGVMDAKGSPLQLLVTIPRTIAQMNPEIALIGLVSLIILFGLPFLKAKWMKVIPSQMLVILITIPLGMAFHLTEEHTYSFAGETFKLSEDYLVKVPNNLLNAITHPDFSALQHFDAWKWVIMFSLIGSLESLLSAKAVDLIDPWKRKTSMNRDLFAVGVANTAVAFIGGLPMISEIVRSKANIDNGARTRFADFWHGLFLLSFVALVPGLIHQIPLAALAAMLVYTGFRLASPREFVHAYHIGREQLLIFVATLIGVLATDLLIGVFIGIGVKFTMHILNGVPIRSLFKPNLEVDELDQNTYVIRARESAVFSNWIPFKRQIEEIGLVQRKNVVVDLSATKLVDHSVMAKLHELEQEFEQEGLNLKLTGLGMHTPVASHAHATRRQSLKRMKRMMIIAEDSQRNEIKEELLSRDITLLTSEDYNSLVRGTSGTESSDRVRFEMLVDPQQCQEILSWLRKGFPENHFPIVSVETVAVIPFDHGGTGNSNGQSSANAEEPSLTH